MPNADEIIVGAAAVCIDGTDIGLTSGGATVRTDISFTEVEADQIPGMAKISKSSERWFVTTTVLQPTLDLIRKALGYPVENLSGSVLTLGYNDSCFLPEHSVALKGPGPGCGCRTFEFSRVVSVSSPEYNMQKDTPVEYEIEFEVLPDVDTGQFGTITDGCAHQDTVACA